MVDMDVTPKKLLITQMHESLLKNSTAFIEERHCRLFLVVSYNLYGYILLGILINFIFDSQTTLFIAKIAQSHLHYSPTSLVLKLVHFLFTAFLAKVLF